MEKIKSFQVDHRKLLPGLYVSRLDTMDGFSFTTFDLRFTRPNLEPVMDTSVCHTIEHMGATFFRSVYPEMTMYFGPMGCRTGFYLIVRGAKTSGDLLSPVKECMNYIIGYEGEIPGDSEEECGNHLDLNLTMAKYHAKRYLAVLEEGKNLVYPE